MAIKAKATITLSFMVDIKSVCRYYKLQASTATAPTKPTTNPPSGWTTTEPNYTTGSTNTLYFVDLTVFTNDTFVYSEVSKSSSYEAAKEAYNKAVAAGDAAAEAAKTATNYMDFEDGTGLIVGNMTDETLGNNILIDTTDVKIRNGSDTLAKFGKEISFYGRYREGGDLTNIMLIRATATQIEDTEYYDNITEIYSLDNMIVSALHDMKISGDNIKIDCYEGQILLKVTSPQSIESIVLDGGGNRILVKNGDFNYNIQTKESGDCNTIIESGKYYIGNTGTNKPTGKNGWLECMLYSTNFCHQRYTTYDGIVYERNMQSGSWDAWRCLDRSAIQVYISAQKTLTTSASKVTLGNTQAKIGSNLTAYNGGVKCGRNGTVSISCGMACGDGFTDNDLAHIVVYKNSTSISDMFYRVVTSWHNVSTTELMLSVSSGDVLYYYAYNQTYSRGVLYGANKATCMTVKYIY